MIEGTKKSTQKGTSTFLQMMNFEFSRRKKNIFPITEVQAKK